MKKFIPTLLASVALLALSSCMDTKEPQSTATYSLTNPFSYITDLNDDSRLLLAGPEYEFEYDFVKMTGKITIKGLQVNALGSRMDLLIEDAPFKFDSQQVLQISIPSYESTSGSHHTVTEFNLRQVGRVVSGSLNAMYYDLSFTIDGRYKVRAVQSASLFAGKTTVTNTTTETSETSSLPFFGYSLNLEKKTAIITVANITIDKNYKSEVNFAEIPFEVSDQGVRMSAEGEVKAYGFTNQEIPNFKVTDFSVRASFLPELFVHFVVNGDNVVNATGTYYIDQSDSTTNQ